jgi:mono/diheme cytochrome c family protein
MEGVNPTRIVLTKHFKSSMYRPLLLLIAVLFLAVNARAQAPAATPEQLALGKTIYMTTCMPCHQPTGAGLFPAFPPLTKSPYVSGSPERLVSIVLKGNNPPFTVDGKLYAAVPMPPQEVMLTDEKIAAVATYVRANFGNTGGPVAPEIVAAARKKFTDRKTPWTQAELDAWKE